jgi:polygalacturonase
MNAMKTRICRVGLVAGLLAVLCLPAISAEQRPVFNVRAFGAAGDARTKDTAAIAKAIETCDKAGGGTVYFPPGKYLTGAIRLKSRVTLEIEAGAVILGSRDPQDYPAVPSPWEDGRREISALIYADGASDITIKGRGVIDGQGEVWWQRQRLANPKGQGRPLTAEEQKEAAMVKLGRPHLVKLVRSNNILMEGLTLVNSPSWTVNPVFCEFVTIRGLTLINPPDSPNTDGINPESCRNVHISNCHIDVGDDCVTLKSGKDEAGRRAGRPTENVTVTNCTMIHGHGGIVIGSEMSGDVRNVTVANCVFQQTLRGIRIKSQRGRGGVVEGLTASNIVMEDVSEPFSITMYYSGRAGEDRTEPVGEGTPAFRDILLSNIFARGARIAGQILGLPEMPISGVSLSNVRVSAKQGFEARWAKDLAFHNVQIDTEKGPALLCRNVEGLEIDGFRSLRPHARVPVIALGDVQQGFLRGCWAARGTDVFLDAGGDKSRNIVLVGNELQSAKEAVAAPPGLVTVRP